MPKHPLIKRRLLTPYLRSQLAQYPAVVLVGPRQCGKTTLSKSIGPLYFDLEKEGDQIRLDAMWDEVVRTRGTVIMDEAQAYPAIFARLRSAIDENRKRMGKFLLLGSVSPSLMKQVGESLAGRMAICELTPFLAAELSKKLGAKSWQFGGFPDGGIFKEQAFPDWQDQYLQLLAQRDLPNWGFSARPGMTMRFFKMLAALHAQQWNASEVGGSLGLTYHTVNSYLDYLIGAFLIRALQPFHVNIRKRLIKSPRVYWRDSGLLHSLLGSSPSDLLSKPWVGRSWEGWVIEQILSTLQSSGRKVDGYYFRTSDGKEIDLVLEMRGELWAIEIKLTSSPSPQMIREMEEAANLIGATRRILISRTSKPIAGKGYWSTSFLGALEILIGLD